MFIGTSFVLLVDVLFFLERKKISLVKIFTYTLFYIALVSTFARHILKELIHIPYQDDIVLWFGLSLFTTAIIKIGRDYEKRKSLEMGIR